MKHENKIFTTGSTDHRKAGEALRKSEKLLRSTQRLAHIGSWEWDFQTNTSYWSDELYRILGYTPGAVTPSYEFFIRHIHPDDISDFQRYIDTYAFATIPHQIEFRIITLEGAPRNLVEWDIFEEDDAGNAVRVFGIVQDITELKQAEEELYKNRLLLRTLIDSLPMWLACLDTEGNYLIANTYYTKTFKLPIERIEGHNFKEFFPTPLYERHKRLNDECFKTGTVVFFEDEHAFEEHKTTYISGVYTPLYDAAGSLWGISAAVHDVTERKRAEEELRQHKDHLEELVDAKTRELQQARAYLENIFQTTGECIIVTDSEGYVRMANRNAIDIFEYSREELIGKHFRMLGAEKFEDASNPPSMQQLFAHGFLKSFQFPYAKKDGSVFTAETNIVLLKNNDGTLQGSIASVRDITERIHVQEKLVREIEDRKAMEKELLARDEELQEVNSALKVLLQRTETDKREIEERILFNVKELVVSYIEKLKNSTLDGRQKTYVNIIESNLNNIISPFGQKLSVKYAALTPSEIHIANLIKEGKSTKEIADILHLSYRTIDFHRKNIRNKLGITNAKANLRSLLLSLQ